MQHNSLRLIKTILEEEKLMLISYINENERM